MLFIKCWSRGEVFISTGWWRVPHKRGWEMTLRQNVSRIRTQPSLAIPQMLAPWRIVECWSHKPLDFKRRCKLFVLGASDLTNTLKKDLIPVLQSICFQAYKNLSVFKCQKIELFDVPNMGVVWNWLAMVLSPLYPRVATIPWSRCSDCPLQSSRLSWSTDGSREDPLKF